MKKNRVRAMLCTALLVFTLGYINPVHAEGEKKLPFAITPVFPSNQDKTVHGYFKLEFKKGKKQTIKIRIRNDKDGELVLLTSPLNALTIANGGIDYSDKTKNGSSKLLDELYSLKPSLTMPESLTLKKGETKELSIDISSPDVSEGTVLGGIDFIEKDASDPSQVGKDGGVSFNILNKVDYKIAIELDYTKSIESDVSIGDAPFKSLPSGPQLYINIINNAPTIEKSLGGTYEVFEPTGDSLFSGEIKNMDMAPKTDVNYPIAWTGKTIGVGKYTIKSTITKDGKTLATATNTFEIKKNNIIQIPHTEPTNPTVIMNKSGLLNQYFIFGGLVIIALTLGILLGRKKRKEEDPKKDSDVE